MPRQDRLSGQDADTRPNPRIFAEDESSALELGEVTGEEDDVVLIGKCLLEEIELDGSEGGSQALRRGCARSMLMTNLPLTQVAEYHVTGNS